jgi:cobalamin biosynthesis protein CobC
MQSSISMAASASATDMTLYSGADEPLLHGGDLSAARRLFPGAPEPFIDLSTGINPYPYPLPRLAPELFARLPDATALQSLATAAARAYAAPSAACVLPAPGTQILLSLVAGLKPPGRAAILAPTYAEHARAARIAGHSVTDVDDIAALAGADLAVVTNPNNPDGRVVTGADLLAVAKALRARGGVLVVDEAFMDVGPPEESLAPELGCGNVVVLRSFGKFFGLAGLRLGFALAAPPLADRLRAGLGPWPVSGPAIAIGASALSDRAWIAATRDRLAQAAKQLDAILTLAGGRIVGGTSLFRLIETDAARDLFHHLGGAGIFVRRFAEHGSWLRVGLPGSTAAWRRFEEAMATFNR